MSTLTVLQIIQNAEIWMIKKSPSEPRHTDQVLHHLKRELNFYLVILCIYLFHHNNWDFFLLQNTKEKERKKKEYANWLISSLHGYNWLQNQLSICLYLETWALFQIPLRLMKNALYWFCWQWIESIKKN